MCSTPGQNVDPKSWALAYQKPIDEKKPKGAAPLTTGSVSGISYSSGKGVDPTRQASLPPLPALPSVKTFGVTL